MLTETRSVVDRGKRLQVEGTGLASDTSMSITTPLEHNTSINVICLALGHRKIVLHVVPNGRDALSVEPDIMKSP